jgi:prevent-host-death family protein
MPRAQQEVRLRTEPADVVSVRQFQKHTTTIIQQVEEHQTPVLVTRMGVPVAKLVPIGLDADDTQPAG